MSYPAGITLVDWFCGAGGSSQGAAAVPGVQVRAAANHWSRAIESHALNFPAADHFLGDLHDADVAKFPSAELFWASPECPTWSSARGKRRDFDKQPDLFGETLPDEAADRSRALMWDVPRYLDAMRERGQPVLAGVVENVTDVRAWTLWDTWVSAIRELGYRTRLIAMNSMHAQPAVTPFAPQSRDRLYLAYWLASLGRDPDWDRWLRPAAWCPSCQQQVEAIQWWKRPGNDMGRYRQQYLYRCPRPACRGQVLDPAVLPAAAAIDWSMPGTRIGDRDRPLAPRTIARIEAGLRKYAMPITIEAHGDALEGNPGVGAWPVTEPLLTPTASQPNAFACPPLIVPPGGTWRDAATAVTEPVPARTTRENDAVAVPFITVHRGGSDEIRTSPVDGPIAAITASGNHFGIAVPPFFPVHATQTASGTTLGLAVPVMVMRNNSSKGDGREHCTPASEPLRTLTTHGHQSVVDWRHLLVPYYGTGVARAVSQPVGSLTATDRYGLARPAVDVDDVLFRMLEPHEIGAAMAFTSGYRVLGSKREKVRQYGNAVTPPVAEVIISALVEAITGHTLDRPASTPDLARSLHQEATHA